MSIRGIAFKSFGLSFLCAAALACSAAAEGPGELEEPTEEVQGAVRPPEACPQILILCAPGYHVKLGPNCRQTCVPDKELCKPRCGDGEYCAECKTLSGSAYVCLPDGTMC